MRMCPLCDINVELPWPLTETTKPTLLQLHMKPENHLRPSSFQTSHRTETPSFSQCRVSPLNQSVSGSPACAERPPRPDLWPPTSIRARMGNTWVCPPKNGASSCFPFRQSWGSPPMCKNRVKQKPSVLHSQKYISLICQSSIAIGQIQQILSKWKLSFVATPS